MEKTTNPKYPYARLTGIREILRFIREPDWRPAAIDVPLLKKLNIASSKEFETINTLRFLGIIGHDGTPTDEFDALKSDYPGTLKRLVLEKYRDLFALLPARLIDQTRLVNFFGLSADTSEYQAKLFSWLCAEASIELPNLEKHVHRSRQEKDRRAARRKGQHLAEEDA